jgi:hypothetical protein
MTVIKLDLYVSQHFVNSFYLLFNSLFKAWLPENFSKIKFCCYSIKNTVYYLHR